MAKITFEDKVALNPQPSIANINKVSDADMNEIKASVNELYDMSAIQQVNPSDYITISNSFTLASGSPVAYKTGNIVFFNFDIVAGTINNGETVLGSATNKLALTSYGSARYGDNNGTTRPATLIAIKNGAFRIHTSTTTNGRCAGTMILMVNE